MCKKGKETSAVDVVEAFHQDAQHLTLDCNPVGAPDYGQKKETPGILDQTAAPGEDAYQMDRQGNLSDSVVRWLVGYTTGPLLLQPVLAARLHEKLVLAAGAYCSQRSIPEGDVTAVDGLR
jgi:hypothetical protein